MRHELDMTTSPDTSLWPLLAGSETQALRVGPVAVVLARCSLVPLHSRLAANSRSKPQQPQPPAGRRTRALGNMKRTTTACVSTPVRPTAARRLRRRGRARSTGEGSLGAGPRGPSDNAVGRSDARTTAMRRGIVELFIVLPCGRHSGGTACRSIRRMTTLYFESGAVCGTVQALQWLPRLQQERTSPPCKTLLAHPSWAAFGFHRSGRGEARGRCVGSS